MKSLIFLIAVFYSSLATADNSEVSCLYGKPGEYPSFVGKPNEMERIEWIRVQVKNIQLMTSIENKAMLFEMISNALDFSYNMSCAAELTELISTNIFTANKIKYSPLLSSMVKAIGNLQDTTAIFQKKSEILIKLISAPRSQFEYAVIPPGRNGPTISDRELIFLRELIARQFVKSNLLLNSDDYRKMLAKVAMTANAHEVRHEIFPQLEKLLDYYLHSFGNSPNISGGASILKFWIKDTKRLLKLSPASGGVYDTVLDSIHSIGKYSAYFGVTPKAQELLQWIVDNESALNAVHWRADLIIANAKYALATVETGFPNQH